MKLLKYRLMVTTLLLVAIITAIPNGAYAASNVHHTINDTDMYGKISIRNGSISASTSASEPLYMTVTLDYTYALAGTMNTKSVQLFNAGFKTNVNVKTDAIDATLISAIASHNWIVEGNRWSGATFITP